MSASTLFLPQKISPNKPVLRTTRSNASSILMRTRSRTPDPLEREGPDPRIETQFCHFLKSGIREGDFSVPENFDDISKLAQAFRMWLKYNDTSEEESRIEDFLTTLELDTVRLWATLYAHPGTSSPQPQTWLRMELERDRAKLLADLERRKA